MADVDRVSLLVQLDPGVFETCRVHGRPLDGAERALLDRCDASDFRAALDVVAAMIDVAADRLQPHGFADLIRRQAFADALARSPERRFDIVTLHARRALLERLAR
jgi:hypothetical protein